MKNNTQKSEQSCKKKRKKLKKSPNNIQFAFGSQGWSQESFENLRQFQQSGDRHISFRKKRELDRNDSPHNSHETMAEVHLNSENNIDEKKKGFSLLNYQKPQSAHGRFQHNLHFLHYNSDSYIDEKNDLVPTSTLIFTKEMKFWIPVYLCLILCLSLLTVIIIIHTHRSDGDSLIRRGNNTHQGNFTMSSSSFIEEGRKRDFLLQYEDQEESDLETAHFIVKACIEKIHTPPNRCQEQCESKKCCFEEFNCETTLTADQCIIYAACRDWLVTTYIRTVEGP